MNKSQKTILVVGLLLLGLMCLFPPWLETLDVRSIHTEKPLGYYFVFSPPKELVFPHSIVLDMNRLVVQCVAVVALALLMLILAKHKWRNPGSV
jgi:hypothetical protein